MSTDRPTVLVVSAGYLPATRFGGPVQSLVNLVDSLHREFDFRIFCGDRDLGDSSPFPGVLIHDWIDGPRCRVFHARPGPRGARALPRVCRQTGPALVYLNSFFSPWFGIAPVFLAAAGLLGRQPLLLAPRGEFSPGALAIKGPKKRWFLRLARWSGAYRSLHWHLTSDLEVADFRTVWGPNTREHLAANISTPPDGDPSQTRPPKSAGRLRLLFLSRISRKKNLAGVFRFLRLARSQVHLTIAGPAEDEEYWGECRQTAALLPPSVTWQHIGSVPHADVARILTEHDLFVLPTAGENFGHAICEALTAGCPILISDRTPWTEVGVVGAGWALPLQNETAFAQAVDEAAGWDENAWRARSAAARAFADKAVDRTATIEATRRMLREAMAQPLARNARVTT